MRNEGHRAEAPATGPRMKGDRSRFLSEADCRAIGATLARAATGGGATGVALWSHWTGHVRWARNQIVACGDVRQDFIKVNRNVNGANNNLVLLNQTTDAALVAATRRAERMAGFAAEEAEWDLELKRYTPEQPLQPHLFSEATSQLSAEQRVATAMALAKTAVAQGVMSAGYIEISANCVAALDSLGNVAYVPYTQASYSVTVRDPQGGGSGWAGVDWYDWNRINAPRLTAVALEKCLQSRHPVAIEPGRYTTILEPQAVSDFVGHLIRSAALSKVCNQWDCANSNAFPFTGTRMDRPQGVLGMTQLGEPVVDERISIWADPMDPELGFTPLQPNVTAPSVLQDVRVYHPATWIKDGVLATLPYRRDVGIDELGHNTGLPNEMGFRMSGGETSVADMIASTTRGLLVTRFYDVQRIDGKSQLYRGYTRDGLWLIEHGKISKAVKNLAFTESILAALNNVEQLGVPQRVFNPSPGGMLLPEPAVVPPLKIKDFSFTALTDAV